MEIFRRQFSVSNINLNFIAVVFTKITYFWVGDNNYTCKDLHCSFPLKNIKDGNCSGTTLLGDLDSISSEIANTLGILTSFKMIILARIYKRGIFMSVNVEELDSSLLPEFQEKLFEQIFGLFPRNKNENM
ncbi:uncharacterized protein TA18935 [Theileria annulata]|uniref:Proteasome assembly chaperone 4 n=1 Tax=Theileria annulata TaxID=5874 RepID=Q4UG69_THEAN|nr:uncharacterized protein TA18935 [Theileria annulata]CAI73920.1 hypothetical protein TA18935 [Theileria annulata]|eukprot:XP_954597.1 hypothetical protein TA18935 [Theileria annulata]